MVSSIEKECWKDGAGRMHEGQVHQVVQGFSVISCELCDFKHVVPLPSPLEMETVYSHDYYTREKPLYIQHYLEDRSWWDAIYKERYEALEQYRSGAPGSLLDIGSGPGLFLDAGRVRGWSVTGIEPSEQACAYSREELGLDVHNIFLNTHTAAGLGTFDVVHMGEVLEHLSDPADMLSTAKALLNPNGILVLIVPNDFNPFQEMLRDHLGYQPWWVAPPHHLNYFEKNSLERLVRRVGFDVLHTESTFPIDMFLMMGKNYVAQGDIGREVHGWRKSFDQTLLAADGAALRRKLYVALADIGLGRETVLYARKRS